MALKEGSKAPKFQAQSYGGEIVKLDQLLADGALVLYFYPKDMTSGCTTQTDNFNQKLKSFKKLGCQVVGVSPDSVKSHEKFRDKLGLDFLLLADTDHSIAEKYGVWVEKSMYGRKYMGIERSTFLIGSDGKIAAMWSKVKVANHVDEVLSKV
jgi:thioredoxin-dependent peroxiredoxin